MTKQILLLRLSYWIPALADFVIAYLALVPEAMGVTNIVYPMGLTSAIAFSWGVMLLIADRKPIERRWVLIPTIIVVSLLTLARVVFSQYDMIDFNLAVFLFGIGLVGLMMYSYFHANKQNT